jgi:hypothetical protein
MIFVIFWTEKYHGHSPFSDDIPMKDEILILFEGKKHGMKKSEN